MGRREVVEIPYEPRPLQAEYHNRTQRFAVLVCHRRFGKTVAAINDLIRDCLICPHPDPRVAYIAPTYKQAKNIAWDYAQKYTRPIPGVEVNQAELRVDLPNGGRLRLFGADNPDSLRGIYLDAVVIDEYAQISQRLWQEIILPTLADRQGRATFIGTPKGLNQFHELYQRHKDDPEWYVRVYRASETGYVPQQELDAQRAISSEAEYNQEYECSWTAAIEGSYYGKLLENADKEGRIRSVNADLGVPVETWWDLGIGDATAIWFVQRVGPEIRVLDFYETHGEPLAHYVDEIDARKRKGGWALGVAVLPHDANQRSLDTGKSRVETLKSLGLKTVVLPPSKVEDGIEAVRRMLPNCWFDSLRCQYGLDALRQYHAELNPQTKAFKRTPYHDWASHAADAFRYGAMYKPIEKKWEPLKYDNRGYV